MLSRVDKCQAQVEKKYSNLISLNERFRIFLPVNFEASFTKVGEKSNAVTLNPCSEKNKVSLPEPQPASKMDAYDGI